MTIYINRFSTSRNFYGNCLNVLWPGKSNFLQWKTEFWEFLKGWERGTFLVVASDQVMQVTFFMLIGGAHQYE